MDIFIQLYKSDTVMWGTRLMLFANNFIRNAKVDVSIE